MLMHFGHLHLSVVCLSLMSKNHSLPTLIPRLGTGGIYLSYTGEPFNSTIDGKCVPSASPVPGYRDVILGKPNSMVGKVLLVW